MMRFSNITLLALVCLLLHSHAALGHTYLSSIQIDGTDLAEGDCVRPHPAQEKEYPIPLVTQADMRCGWLPEAAQPANRNCPVSAGATIGIQWYHTAASATDDIIAPTHLGPCLVYLAKSADGAGPVWFKIWEDGYDASTQKWCVDTLLANKGLFTFKLPANISPGNYLLRAEILALHGAHALNGVQPYVGCVQLTISGSGTANPPSSAMVSLPGAYSPNDPGMLFDIYQAITSYPIPGPAVWTGESGGESTSGTAAPTSAPSTPKPSSQATTRPTSAPATSAPATSAPATSAPATSAPATSAPATSAPATSAPATSAPSTGSSSTVRVQLFPSSSEWWFAVTARSTPDVKDIEMKDSGSYSSWNKLQTTSWGYWVFPAATNSIKLPISLRLTATNGVQMELTNIIQSWSNTVFLDTGKGFSDTSASVTSVPATSAPATSAPTQKATSAPTPKPTKKPKTTKAPTTAPTQAATTSATPTPTSSAASNLVLDMHQGSSQWWFAIAFEGLPSGVSVHDVSVTDSSSFRTYQQLTHTDWGYWQWSTSGTAMIAPLYFKITSTSGDSVTFPLPTITPGTDFDTGVQLS